MSETHTLPRDGLRPVRFQGTRLAESSGHWFQGQDQNRYYDLAVYQHDDGRYVLAWHYQTHWRGEGHHDRVEAARSLTSLITVLEDFDPTEWVEGYKPLIARYPHYNKPGQEYFERQLVLERGIRERYLAQVRDLCAALAADYDIAEAL